jgi:proline racemase
MIVAKKIRAINAYRPRIKKNSAASKDDIVARIDERSLMSEGQVRASISDLLKAVSFYLLHQQDVDVEGLGRLMLDIGMDGKIRLSLKVDPRYVAWLDAHFDKSAETIENVTHIGKTDEDAYDWWDARHPDDPVERG